MIEDYLGRGGKKIAQELSDLKEFGFVCAFCKKTEYVKKKNLLDDFPLEVTLKDEQNFITFAVCNMCYEFLIKKFSEQK